MRRNRLAALLLLATAPFAAGCEDAARVGSLETEVTELRAQLKKSENERDRLARRVDESEKRLAGLQEDLLGFRKSVIDVAGAAAASAPDSAGDGADGVVAPAGPDASPANPVLTAEAASLARILETDEGVKVLEAALRDIDRRRDDQRTARMIQGLVDAFAQKANLTPTQSEQLAKVLTRGAAARRELWTGMRDAPEMTPEQRVAVRQEILAKSEEIRVRVDDEVKSVLDAQQFETYKQDSERLWSQGRGGGAGGMGGGMGGAGFGGRAGRGGQGEDR